MELKQKRKNRIVLGVTVEDTQRYATKSFPLPRKETKWRKVKSQNNTK